MMDLPIFLFGLMLGAGATAAISLKAFEKAKSALRASAEDNRCKALEIDLLRAEIRARKAQCELAIAACRYNADIAIELRARLQVDEDPADAWKRGENPDAQ